MNLPLFPDFKLVGLEDRGLIQSRIEAFPAEASEVSFANVYIWRHYDHPMLTVIRDNLCLLFQPPDEAAYFLQPIGGNCLHETIAACLGAAPRLSRVPASFAAQFCTSYRCQPDRDNDDYVYRTEDLAELVASRYDAKRNRIRKFERNHAYSYHDLGVQHRSACHLLLDKWAGSKGSRDGYLMAQVAAVQEALEHFEQLGLRGGVIEVGGRVEAFSIGEKLNPTTAVIHIEIANPAYDGLAQLINREFVRHAWSQFPFINREQDMGLPGLRKAKLSYQPHHRVEKHIVWELEQGRAPQAGTARNPESPMR